MYNGDTEKIANGSWEYEPGNKTAFISPDPSVKGIILTRPEPIKPLPSPEAIVKQETTGDSEVVKEENYDS